MYVLQTQKNDVKLINVHTFTAKSIFRTIFFKDNFCRYNWSTFRFKVFCILLKKNKKNIYWYVI